MKHGFRFALVAWITCTTSLLAGEGSGLLIHNVHLVPMTGERSPERGWVAVGEGRITAMGIGDAPRAAAFEPDLANVVDGGGGYLVPGLIEPHVHLRKTLSLDLFLGHGVTTARCMDGTPEVLAWRDAIAGGEMLGPQVVTASPFLHRSAQGRPERYVGDVEDAVRLTRRYAEEGYDYIKIAELDAEPFFALMAEAERLDIPVVGHIPNYELDLALIFDAGMTSVEHLEELFRVYFDYEPDTERIPGFVDLVRRSGVPVSTLITSEQVKNGLFAEREAYLTQERRAWVERFNGPEGIERLQGTLESIETGEWQRPQVDIGFLLDLVRALHEAGVVLVPGSDSGGSFVISGPGLHSELELFVRAGLTPYEALHSATVSAAMVLGLADRKGTIEVGKDADLVLVDGNPLEDLGVLREPQGLAVRGGWLGSGELSTLRGRRYP